MKVSQSSLQMVIRNYEVYMDIEISATSAVQTSLCQSDYIKTHISQGDKEPSFDGYIYIQPSKINKKVDLKRVAVQIKGKLSNDLTKDTISFPISTIDMRNYLFNGGVFYFVVYIDRCGKTNIYYNPLTPVKLKLYLENAEGKKTKTILLKRFPDSNNEKEMALLNFYEDCLKQTSFAKIKLPTLDELEKMNVLESLSIGVSSVNGNDVDLEKAMLRSDFYIYAKVKGSSIPQPLPELPEKLHIYKIINYSICANGEKFYDLYRVIRNKDEDTFVFGESTKMVQYSLSSDWRINHKPTGNLKTRINDMRFFTSAVEAGSFTIDDYAIPLNLESITSRDDYTNHKKMLENYMKIQSVLDILGVSKELDLDVMDSKDLSNLEMLFSAVIENRTVSGLNSKFSPVSILKIANLELILAFTKSETEDRYNVLDFFKIEMNVFYDDSEGVAHRISQFSILKKEHYIELSNINYKAIIDSFKMIPEFEIINYSLLEMIGAYDVTSNENLYDAALEIANWLMSTDNLVLPKEVKLLNLLQLVRRKREFSDSEIEMLNSIINSDDQREDVLVAAFLLLGNRKAAFEHFSLLTSEEQDSFKQFPIYKFA